jgi:hypothetical protein
VIPPEKLEKSRLWSVPYVDAGSEMDLAAEEVAAIELGEPTRLALRPLPDRSVHVVPVPGSEEFFEASSLRSNTPVSKGIVSDELAVLLLPAVSVNLEALTEIEAVPDVLAVGVKVAV